MQNQRTAHKKIDFSELPDLTAQQLKFAEAVASGKSGAEAYRLAYDCKGSAQHTIWTEASRLRHRPDIALWIAAIRAGGAEQAILNREQYVRRLLELSQVAENEGNLGASVQAMKHAGDAMGHHTHDQRFEVTHTISDTMEELARITSPEIAEAIAREAAKDAGLSWSDENVQRRTLN